MTRLKRFKAKSKREKCKYKRCMYKRTHPENNPRYCVVHNLIMNETIESGRPGFYGPIMYRAKPLEATAELTTATAYYAIINGRCAWCGKSADKLPNIHYQIHDKAGKLKKFIFR